MEKDYSTFLVKDYQYWQVSVAENQGYLGRCVVWCKRENALDMTDATLEEQAELFRVLTELKNACSEIFKPDWFNYSFLGNEVKHLHGHFIPRYATPKTFMGIVFEDKLYGHNYKTDSSFVTPESVVFGVRDHFKKGLNQL